MSLVKHGSFYKLHNKNQSTSSMLFLLDFFYSITPACDVVHAIRMLQFFCCIMHVSYQLHSHQLFKIKKKREEKKERKVVILHCLVSELVYAVFLCRKWETQKQNRIALHCTHQAIIKLLTKEIKLRLQLVVVFYLDWLVKKTVELTWWRSSAVCREHNSASRLGSWPMSR